MVILAMTTPFSAFCAARLQIWYTEEKSFLEFYTPPQRLDFEFSTGLIKFRQDLWLPTTEIVWLQFQYPACLRAAACRAHLGACH